MKSLNFYCCLVFIGASISASAAEFPRQVVPGLQQIARIQVPALRESSGLAASRQFTNVFWTHNDKGNAQVLYAIARDGSLLGQFDITGAQFSDWEEVATDDKGNLYLGDIGNNDAKRNELAVYQITEPDPKAKNKSVAVTRSWKLRFPGKPFDCESLFILGTNAYVFSKVFDDARSTLYRFPLSEDKEPLVLEVIAETKIKSPVTAADVSRDGSLLGVTAKSGAFVFQINGDVRAVGSLEPQRVKIKGPKIEGCAFVPDGLMATAESGEIYLFNDPAFRPGTK